LLPHSQQGEKNSLVRNIGEVWEVVLLPNQQRKQQLAERCLFNLQIAIDASRITPLPLFLI
jgi:hypothetical protein